MKVFQSSLLLLLVAACSLLPNGEAFVSTARRCPAALPTSGHRRVLVSALASDEGSDPVMSRRAAAKEAAFTAAAAIASAAVLAPTAANADIYDDQRKAAAEKRKQDAEKGKSLVPAVLGGGLLLSLPFFFPNLLRLGTKLSSLGEDDGYGRKR